MGYEYGGQAIYDESCKILDQREICCWITGERLGTSFGVASRPGEFLFRVVCTGQASSQSAASPESPGDTVQLAGPIKFLIPYFHRVIFLSTEAAAIQLAIGPSPVRSSSGIRTAGGMNATPQTEGCDQDGRVLNDLQTIPGAVQEHKLDNVVSGSAVDDRWREFYKFTLEKNGQELRW